MSLLQSMSTRGKLLLAGSVVGIAVIAFLLVSLATKPSYATLSAGIDPAQTGKITAALETQGVAYKIGNGGTSIQVPESSLSQARVALAGKGLSASGANTSGWEKFDQQKLGASNFQQKVAYQRALEGQISSTVGQVAGVTGATVQLTMPDDQLFADEQKPATASVLLDGEVEPAAVKGIANLVASAVPNLKTGNVTITNGNGQMLWPSGDNAGGGASKTAAEARYDTQLSAQLNAIVARTVGAEKAQVRVKSDLNVDATNREELSYAKQGTPLKTTEDSERLKGSGGAKAGGAAGSASNVPTYAAAGGGAGGNSNYQRKQGSTEFGVGKVVTHTKVAPGAVQKLDVALMVDPSVPPKTAKALQQAINSAAGINTQRGDVSTLSSVPFVKTPAAAAKASPVAGMTGYIKYAALGLGSLLFLFFVSRHLRRREQGDLLGEPVWLHQIESPRPVGELAAAGVGGGHSHDAMLTTNPNRRRQQIEQAVQREPDRVVQALRSWMAEDE